MTLQMHYDEIAEEARAEAKEEIIAELLLNDVPISVIAKCCKVSEEDVRRLVKERK